MNRQEPVGVKTSRAQRRQEEEERQKGDQDGDPPKPGKPPEISDPPKDKAQRDFTDPEGRIMKNSDKAFIQGYNAQAAVDHENQVFVAADVSRMAPDIHHLKPMVAQIKQNMKRVPDELSADAGYFSEENVNESRRSHMDPLIAAERKKHGERPPRPKGRIPEEAILKERMIRKRGGQSLLRAEEGHGGAHVRPDPHARLGEDLVARPGKRPGRVVPSVHGTKPAQALQGDRRSLTLRRFWRPRTCSSTNLPLPCRTPGIQTQLGTWLLVLGTGAQLSPITPTRS